MSAVVSPLPPTFELELALYDDGCRCLAGVDEVGRGSLAGPVVAAAVSFPYDAYRRLDQADGIRDSKELTHAQRLAAFDVIAGSASAVGIGWATHATIDRVGISPANRQAMLRAVRALKSPPDMLLIDYFALPESPIPQTCVTRGDSRSLSIAAASIVAKVFRDRWMERCDSRYPGYGFASHKGYGTAAHRAALLNLGPSPIHRLTFAPLSGLSE